MPDQPTMKQLGSTHCPCVYDFLFWLACPLLSRLSSSFSQQNSLPSSILWCLYYSTLFSFFFPYSVCLRSALNVPGALSCLLKCRSMEVSSQLYVLGVCACPPATLSNSRRLDDMHYSSLTHLCGLRAPWFWFLPLNFILARKEVLKKCYAGVCKSHRHLVCLFRPLPSLSESV